MYLRTRDVTWIDVLESANDQNSRTILRRKLREQRSAIGAAERIAAATAVAERLEGIPEFLTDERIAGYWAVGGEVPLAAILGGLRARGQRYFLPVVGGDSALRFAPWRPGDAVVANRYGIPEPADIEAAAPGDVIDVVLVPLLGFDRHGHRIGSGAGYYDRTFSFLLGRARPSHPLLVGIGYAAQEVERIEPAAWDVALDYIVTEQEVIEIGESGDGKHEEEAPRA